MNTVTQWIKKWIYGISTLIAPRYCPICGQPLLQSEELICLTCNLGLPRIMQNELTRRVIEQRFWGKFPFVRATSYFIYRKGSKYDRLLFNLKYNGKKETGTILGRWMASELLSTDFFSDVDLLIPIPLHPAKQRKRGYNQSEWIAKGISKVTGIPIATDIVQRTENTETQTQKTIIERWENVAGSFQVKDPTLLINKHILLIDDVLTTGATTSACATACSQSVTNIRISILTLAVAE